MRLQNVSLIFLPSRLVWSCQQYPTIGLLNTHFTAFCAQQRSYATKLLSASTRPFLGGTEPPASSRIFVQETQQTEMEKTSSPRLANDVEHSLGFGFEPAESEPLVALLGRASRVEKGDGPVVGASVDQRRFFFP